MFTHRGYEHVSLANDGVQARNKREERPSSAPPIASGIDEWEEGGYRPLLPMPPGVSVANVDSCMSSMQSAAPMTSQEFLRFVAHKYDLNVQEHDHIEWLLDTGLANAQNIDMIFDVLKIPHKTDTPVLSPIGVLEPNGGNMPVTHEDRRLPEPARPVPRTDPFSSPLGQGRPEYFQIGSVETPPPQREGKVVDLSVALGRFLDQPTPQPRQASAPQTLQGP